MFQIVTTLMKLSTEICVVGVQGIVKHSRRPPSIIGSCVDCEFHLICWKLYVSDCESNLESAAVKAERGGKYFCSCFEVSHEKIFFQRCIVMIIVFTVGISWIFLLLSHISSSLDSTSFIRYKMHEMNELHYVMSQIISHSVRMTMISFCVFFYIFLFASFCLALLCCELLLLELKNFFMFLFFASSRRIKAENVTSINKHATSF